MVCGDWIGIVVVCVGCDEYVGGCGVEECDVFWC